MLKVLEERSQMLKEDESSSQQTLMARVMHRE